ncbi:dihydrofolate reductase-like domain-containing protein [Ilyonectria robusta]|uniref:dihydrofolate reductase-like domain-containing protein n=1 Tax=Ilyonectria robusta TaxID=1079257 RepID=UPI001E8D8CB9|nr:dihydrofolate reductase-like domain-containing protein [Ilyonectria robusta]KAH8669367.1 dihydrofolate reductase-like domain-containing protein [Ilyonectria robusta]
MPQLRYNVATTLDGYIASSNGSTDWIVEDSSIDFEALYREFDFFVMGRKTYEVMVALGAPSENPLFKRPKNAVIVASRTMRPEDFPNITVISENIVDFIRDLKSGNGKDIWLMGGGTLATQCLEAGLLNSIEAAVMPVILGDGIRMIEEFDRSPAKLNLTGCKCLDSGIIMTQYLVVAEKNK